MPKLLVVDDEVDIQEFAKKFFSKRGVEVFSCGNAKEALTLVDTLQPDLVLLDVHMDEMTGVEMLRQLRGKGNDVKIVMVTGVEDEEIVNEANSWGIRGYIHKPLILEELERIVLSELGIG